MDTQDQTNLIIALLNQVKDELKSDIADIRKEIDAIQHKKQPFDWRHALIGIALIASLSFNFGNENAKLSAAKSIDSLQALHVAKASASSTYVDIAKTYKLTNGNSPGNP